jgi:hypothetical protein
LPSNTEVRKESEMGLSTSGFGLKFELFLILITMAHRDRSIRKRVFALAEEGRLSASTAGEMYGVPMSTEIPEG